MPPPQQRQAHIPTDQRCVRVQPRLTASRRTSTPVGATWPNVAHCTAVLYIDIYSESRPAQMRRVAMIIDKGRTQPLRLTRRTRGTRLPLALSSRGRGAYSQASAINDALCIWQRRRGRARHLFGLPCRISEFAAHAGTLNVPTRHTIWRDRPRGSMGARSGMRVAAAAALRGLAESVPSRTSGSVRLSISRMPYGCRIFASL